MQPAAQIYTTISSMLLEEELPTGLSKISSDDFFFVCLVVHLAKKKQEVI